MRVRGLILFGSSAMIGSTQLYDISYKANLCHAALLILGPTRFRIMGETVSVGSTYVILSIPCLPNIADIYAERLKCNAFRYISGLECRKLLLAVSILEVDNGSSMTSTILSWAGLLDRRARITFTYEYNIQSYISNFYTNRSVHTKKTKDIPEGKRPPGMMS